MNTPATTDTMTTPNVSNTPHPSCCACRSCREQRDGIIHTPGKFEGCPTYAPYFWEIGMDGMADSDSNGVWTFKVTAEDRQKFPTLKGVRTVRLSEDGSGFVHVR